MKVIKPKSDFEQVSGKVIREFDVLTIGVYAKLLSFGEGWKMNIKGLSKSLDISVDKVRKAVTALEDAGYIVRTPIYKDGRLRGWDYVVYGNCVDEADRSNAGCSVSQNQTTLKSDNTEIDQDNNNILESNIILQDNNTQKTNKVCSKEPKAPKIHYADFVTMTEKEHDNLVRDYGTKNTEWMINKLNNYKGAKGITYKSDYLATLNWVVGECAKAQGLAELPKIDHRPDWQKAGASSEEEYNLFTHKK